MTSAAGGTSIASFPREPGAAAAEPGVFPPPLGDFAWRTRSPGSTPSSLPRARGPGRGQLREGRLRGLTGRGASAGAPLSRLPGGDR